MKPLTQHADTRLADAFEVFNSLSLQLSASYKDLEQQVARLSQELAEAHSERVHQWMEKERLAQRLESLLDTLPAGIIVLDDKGCIRQSNPLAREMLGDAIDGSEWPVIAKRAIQMKNNELRLADGRWIGVTVEPLKAEPGRLILLVDVTETRELQSMLSRQRRLGALGEMVAGLAHQLRTPLATALLYLSSLQHPNITASKRDEFTGKVSERLQHLEHILNDMLIFARGDMLASETIQVSDVAKRLQHQIAPLLQQANIRFELQYDPDDSMIRANVDTLLSGFQNLVDNAVQACEPGSGIVKIDITSHHSVVVFRFVDNGCGMSESLQNRVMEPFFTTRDTGCGLGLAVVNAIIETCEGSLELDSAPGQGSCFTVTLPLYRHDTMLNSNISAVGTNYQCNIDASRR